MTRSASARRFASAKSGATAVEFALVAPLLMTMIGGVLALGAAYYEGATIQWALERSLRSAMIHADLTAADIEELMADDLALIGSPDVAFDYQIDESGAVPVAIVSAEYDVPLEIPFIPEMALHFRAENVAPAPVE